MYQNEENQQPFTAEERNFILYVQLYCNSQSKESTERLMNAARKAKDNNKNKALEKPIHFFSDMFFAFGDNAANVIPMSKIVQKEVDESMKWLDKEIE